MVFVEQITQYLLLWLTVMSPNPVPVEVWSNPQYSPSVYVIPQSEFADIVCGCECTLSGMYLGGPDHRVVLGGDTTGWLPNEPLSNSIHLHELEHYFQDLRYRVLSQPGVTREQGERDAYTIQNIYLTINGYFPIDIDNMVSASANIAYGKVECLDGTVNTPPASDEVMNRLNTAVFKHEQNRELWEFYQTRPRCWKP